MASLKRTIKLPYIHCPNARRSQGLKGENEISVFKVQRGNKCSALSIYKQRAT